MQTYFTLQPDNGPEKSMADWGISSWRREVTNQGGEVFGFNLLQSITLPDQFAFGARVTIRIGRIPSATNPVNPTLPPTLDLNPNLNLSYSAGRVWMIAYRDDSTRSGTPEMESFAYKFAGPWDFFFGRTTFRKLFPTYSAAAGGYVADYRDQVVLGMSLTAQVGANDTIPGTIATNLLSISQQVREIVQYCANESAYEQTVNGLGWPAGPQFQSDNLTAVIDNINYDLVPAGANVLIPDFLTGYAVAGKTSASLPAGAAQAGANVNTILRAPLDAVQGTTCAECVKKMLRWIGAMGSAVQWFDHGTQPPTLHVATRDILPSVTLPFPPASPISNLKYQISNCQIRARADLTPPAVHLQYRLTGTAGNQAYEQIINDIVANLPGLGIVEAIGPAGQMQKLSDFIAGNGNILDQNTQNTLMFYGRRAASISATLNFQGPSQAPAAQLTCTALANVLQAGQLWGAALSTAPVPGSNPPSLSSLGSLASFQQFWLRLFPDLAQTANLALGGPAITVTDTNGNPLDTVNAYPYLLVDGQITPWMRVQSGGSGGTPGQAIKAIITATFSYDEYLPAAAGTPQVTGSKTQHTKTATVTLTNLPAGAYTSPVSPGEVIPYGLAGYIYNIEQLPLYEGSLTLQEQDVTDLCPIGNNLNITGGAAEWAAMNAVIQSVAYDSTGKTVLTFGPAKTLGPADFAQRLTVNRPPRAYYLIGGDMSGKQTQSGSLGNNLPTQAPTPAPPAPLWQMFPTNLAAYQTVPPAAGTMPPGVHIDARAAGAPLLPPGWSAIAPAPLAGAAPGQQILLVGANNAFIRISIADLIGDNIGVWLQEFQVCVMKNGQPTTMYAQFLATAPYADSIAG